MEPEPIKEQKLIKEIELIEQEPKEQVITKKKYFYGDKYKGLYKDTHQRIYQRNKILMTEEQKTKKLNYIKEYKQTHKEKYKNYNKVYQDKVKTALKLLEVVK